MTRVAFGRAAVIEGVVDGFPEDNGALQCKVYATLVKCEHAMCMHGKHHHYNHLFLSTNAVLTTDIPCAPLLSDVEFLDALADGSLQGTTGVALLASFCCLYASSFALSASAAS